MAQRRPRDQRVVRNRRVAIYTFLLILTLFYISAHRTVQKEREMEALRAETAEEGPGIVSDSVLRLQDTGQAGKTV